MKHLLLLTLLLLLQAPLRAQQVGLVFSGGGAKGLAHIGVLKALEENNIPIDYVVGTSMGGIVGGMYAAGYTPQEIEKIALSAEFQKWVSGTYESDYSHYFEKKPPNPSFLTAKLQVDTGFNFKLRSNLINDVPLNFALLELFGQASINSNGNFDSLFVPFRCIVSDVLSQKMIAVKQGNLPEAIRGTFTVPLVYRPIKVDDKYVFDGGLYNNFPIDVLKSDFKPDYIIGTNVSSKIFNEYPSDNDEKLMNRFLIYLFLSKSDSTSIGENGTYIQPAVSEFSTTNFNPVAELIKRGYDATMADMPKIKAEISRRTNASELNRARDKFNNSRPDLRFGSVKAIGLNSKQTKYVESVLKGPLIGSQSLEEVKEGYYHLVADDNFETVYPRINHQSDSGNYNFELLVEAKKNFKVDFGGVISTRPISNAYIGLQYNYLRKKSYTLSANFYAGGFYESAQGTIRIDIPAQIPFYLESEFTYNHSDYFNKGQIFVENVSPTFVEQSDRKMALKIGTRLGSGKLEAQAGYINFDDRYSPTQTFQIGDIMDFNSFNGGYNTLIYTNNKLNRRQYANTGSHTELSFSYYRGIENYTPGNIFRGQIAYNLIRPERNDLDWVLARFVREKYFITKKNYSLGYISEVVLSNRPSFSTYKASILSAPAFNPLQDSKSLLLENFRANTYGAIGLKNVFKIRKNFDARIEAYLFQPMEKIFQFGLQSVSYGDIFADRHYAASAGLVFHTLGGPISLSINHYDDSQKRFGMMFHMGFLIYNKRSFE